MTEYKASRYNFTFPYTKAADGKEQRVLYNARTGSLALIEAEKYGQYCKLAENGTPIADEELLSDLREGGYVVDADFNELLAIRYNLLRHRYVKNCLGLTVAPTSDCNFRCVYCYEKDSIRPVTMSAETQAALLEFVKDRLPNIEALNITWYGGEPLLAIDIMEKLSGKLISLCEENKISYEADIVTNGVLLTRKMMERLAAIRVTQMQITLDGAAEDHDKRRFLKGGHPTFDRIIENLVNIKDLIQTPVSIRINADRHNIDRVDNVIRILAEKGLREVTAPYLAMVENRNGTYNDNSCLHANEFSLQEFEFITRNGLNILSRIPRQVANYCGADFDNAFVIGPDGRIYKCWNEIGIAGREVGTLRDGIREGRQLYSYLLYDATRDEGCADCKYLPLCMGGCPYLRLHSPAVRCTAMKHGLAAFMDVIPSILEQQIDEANAAQGAE